MKWKKLKIAAGVVMMLALVLLSMSCSKSTASTTSTTKTATVQKGDLAVSITGTGNLAYSKTEKLAFEMAGYVEEVLVSAGDTVKEGDEIARLNTSDWNDKITALTKTLTAAQRNLTTAQSNVTKAQRALATAQADVTKAQRTVEDKQLSVQQAQLDAQQAEYNLSQMDDVKIAQTRVDNAQSALLVAQSNLKYAGLLDSADEKSYWGQQINRLEADLEKAQATLQKTVSGNDVTLTTDVNIQISQDQLKIDQAKRAVEAAQIAVDDANTSVNDAKLDEADAQAAVSSAQLDQTDAGEAVQEAEDSLSETKALSPVIKAPFDGFITKVNVSGGDEVFKGSVAAVISDPNKFEADILVTENDIFSVKVNGDATVSLDALSDLTYPATITKISPTATVSSGVVNYSVTVELTSLVPATTQASMPQPPAGAASSGSQPASTTSAIVTLKDGLSATVKIISEQANNVLIVPAKAITTQGPRSTVQVVTGETSETRVVTVGMTDGTNTEISSGLSEGDKVTYKVSSSASISSSSKSNSQSGIGIGIGGGGPPPGGF